jgi:methyl-accepting chemotaxis protein
LFASGYNLREELRASTEEKLAVTLEGYSGDVNYLQDNGIDITVFEGDTRVESSIAGAVGTKASDKVISEVLNNGNVYFDPDIKINGIDYYGYYIPTEDGMLFAGQTKDNVNASMKSLIISLFIISVVVFCISNTIIIMYAYSISDKISKFSALIKQLAEGKLRVSTEDIKTSLDEFYDMKNSINSLSDNMCRLVGQTTEISTEILSSSEELSSIAENNLETNNEISKAIENIAEGANEQSESLQNMTASISNMNNNINDISNKIQIIGNRTNSVNSSSFEMSEKMGVYLIK